MSSSQIILLMLGLLVVVLCIFAKPFVKQVEMSRESRTVVYVAVGVCLFIAVFFGFVLS